MTSKKLLLSVAALVVCVLVNAQKEIPDSARELLFDKSGALTRVVATEDEVAAKIITQNPLLDDVPWRKVVLRVIDLREAQNQALYYPFEDIKEETQKNLFAIIYKNFLTGKLVGYLDEIPTRTHVPLFIPKNEIHGNDTAANTHNGEWFFDEDNCPECAVDPYAKVNKLTQSCIQYYIQEAWYFDKHTSTFHSKILAIAPVFDPKYNNMELGEDTDPNLPGPKPGSIWFWFPYEKVRPFLQEEYVRMSGKNTKQLLNFDDFFTQRQFYSYIIKDYDMTEKDIDNIKMDDSDPNKVVRIKEAEDKVEAEILDFEQDLWNY